jgi:hypothetical protein
MLPAAVMGHHQYGVWDLGDAPVLARLDQPTQQCREGSQSTGIARCSSCRRRLELSAR